MIGIDPHKASHTAVAINGDEVVLDEFTLRASTGQVCQLCDGASEFKNREWAIESANGLGYLLARQLVSAGETVFDVSPVLASRVRVLGSVRSQKNDPNDARSVAIAALRQTDPRSSGQMAMLGFFDWWSNVTATTLSSGPLTASGCTRCCLSSKRAEPAQQSRLQRQTCRSAT